MKLRLSPIIGLLLATAACSPTGPDRFKSSEGSGRHSPLGSGGDGATSNGGSHEGGSGGDASTGVGGWNLGKASPPCDAGPSSAALDIPAGHPRIWWTPDRLAAAKAWYAGNAFTPTPDDPLELSLHYVLTGNTTSARAAIDQLMALDFPLSGTASDPFRWYGEWAIVTYDWCYDQMTDSERATIMTRWNAAVAHWNAASWGAVGMEADNYYWGYLRNSLLWGMATFHDNPQAQGFIDAALQTRFVDSFLPYAAKDGSGGVSTEGTEYGRYMFDYPVMAFTSAQNLGRALFSETNFYCEAVYYLVYTTTPGVTTRTVAGNVIEGMDLFPFSDDQNFATGPLASSDYYGSFANTMAMTWPDNAVGQHARAWIQLAKAPVPLHVQAVDPGGKSASFEGLPLDYYAPGPGYHYARTTWGADATTLSVQMGHPGEVGHSHIDAGNFQMWRGGRWLTRESTGYADSLVGYGGASVESDDFSAHNVVAFQGRALATGSSIEGPPVVVRLETQPDYSYAAVDLSKAFRAHDPGHPERDTPWSSSVVREFLFVRPLETLVVFDRMTSQTAAGVDASDVVKASLLHFEAAPTIVDANHVLGKNGDQALAVTTLLPSAPTYKVTNEGGVGQHRLDIETSGAPESYFLNVLQGRDATAADVVATMLDDAEHYTITLKHPTAGTAVLVLDKGPKSSGGSFAFSAHGAPGTTTPLRADVQQIHVGKEGPYWSP
jgi:hypothetical protein